MTGCLLCARGIPRRGFQHFFPDASESIGDCAAAPVPPSAHEERKSEVMDRIDRLTAESEVARLNGVVEEVAVKLGKERSEVARLTRELETQEETLAAAAEKIVSGLEADVARLTRERDAAVIHAENGWRKAADNALPTPTGDPIDG